MRGSTNKNENHRADAAEHKSFAAIMQLIYLKTGMATMSASLQDLNALVNSVQDMPQDISEVKTPLRDNGSTINVFRDEHDQARRILGPTPPSVSYISVSQ